ncbi:MULTISPECIES: RagB/SusD family nutrient uptake outer membrane protein [Butyricimonas]|uniref:RagB/SusD family nutrient uptake outer membrane protein n=1 Tax=Butyricimonas hominis TaxID=2763032 RepID=A0ABR7CWA5_9BACT|nr:MULTISPECIES: RagB/SusD family nutrient uptake outer membrane protein [Butyricimonas]MBC5619968.1 RagB/SusD family nutrient uptake outer membrane protein [Butyricimonas hominis]MCB6973809.1 RagB/SusD family nutrient uptake outer membrane protein [Butyricimonas synergistica]MCG4520620.1 RagB/SusD family nutrient uptake outer membrane protein [Butyricimonas sp. DFI.6.44]
MKRLFAYLFIPFLMLASCDSWLDVVPEEDIATIDSEFETYDQAYVWLQSAYTYMQKIYERYNDVAYSGTDELVADNYLRNSRASSHPVGLDIIGGRQNVFAPYADTWLNVVTLQSGPARNDFYTQISICNHFITRIDNVYNLPAKDKSEWKAEVIALKAYYYLELVRRYGPVMIVPDSFDPNQDVESLKLPRSHVDTCFNYIVRLCDEVVDLLPSRLAKKTDRRGYFNKEAVMALKARALCYQASDLFNGNSDYTNFVNKNGEPLFSSTPDPQKWERAAQAAIDVIDFCHDAGSAALIEGNIANTPLQSCMLDIEKSTQTYGWRSDEALYMIRLMDGSDMDWFKLILPKFSDGSNHTLPGACFAPSMKMVEMFYTENGLPINQDLKWVGAGNPYALSVETDPKYVDVVALNEPVLNLHRRREPRFYADIVADRCYWRLGTETNNVYLIEMYQGEDFGLVERRLSASTPQNITGYYLKKGTASTATLNAHQGGLTSLGERPAAIFRLAEMYLIAAEALNECKTAPDAEVYKYLNEVRRRAGIPDVEEAWKGARDPGKVKSKTGMREIIRQEWNIEFAFEGFRFWNLRRWKAANVELNEKSLGWNVIANNANDFYNNGRGPVEVYSGNTFVAPRDYFWPIRSEEVQTAGCVQNPGW